MKKQLIIAFIIATVFLLTGCQTKPSEDYCIAGNVEGVYKCTQTWSSTFDTSISLTLYLGPEERYEVEEIFDAVETLLVHYHQLFDKYYAYDGVTNVYTINENSPSATTLDSDLYEAIDYVLQHEKDIKSNGDSIFNIALNPVLKLWHDVRESTECSTNLTSTTCPIPDSSVFDTDFPVDPNDIILDETHHTIAFAKEGMSIDLGGFGKGYAAEKVTDFLDTLSINYLLNAGNSNVKSGGINPNNNDGFYYIALLTPTFDPFSSDYYVILKMPEAMSVVTSGNYQRYVIGESDQRYYHHIIDPRTYYPGGDLEHPTAVTVFYEDGGLADIYSTAVYLLGYDEGLTFVESKPGLEAIWYHGDGSVTYSSGFEAYLYKFTESD